MLLPLLCCAWWLSVLVHSSVCGRAWGHTGWASPSHAHPTSSALPCLASPHPALCGHACLQASTRDAAAAAASLASAVRQEVAARHRALVATHEVATELAGGTAELASLRIGPATAAPAGQAPGASPGLGLGGGISGWGGGGSRVGGAGSGGEATRPGGATSSSQAPRAATGTGGMGLGAGSASAVGPVSALDEDVAGASRARREALASAAAAVVAREGDDGRMFRRLMSASPSPAPSPAGTAAAAASRAALATSPAAATAAADGGGAAAATGPGSEAGRILRRPGSAAPPGGPGGGSRGARAPAGAGGGSLEQRLARWEQQWGRLARPGTASGVGAGGPGAAGSTSGVGPPGGSVGALAVADQEATALLSALVAGQEGGALSEAAGAQRGRDAARTAGLLQAHWAQGGGHALGALGPHASGATAIKLADAELDRLAGVAVGRWSAQVSGRVRSRWSLEQAVLSVHMHRDPCTRGHTHMCSHGPDAPDLTHTLPSMRAHTGVQQGG